jgi:DNA-binding CsgD family transcriptional regulator
MSITAREREVLMLTSNGLSSKQIANQIYLSHYTVNDHLKNLKAKMHAANVAQLVRRGFESGILRVTHHQTAQS